MKNVKTRLRSESKQECGIEKRMFHYEYIIGKGGFGKVWKVELTKTRNRYAMKEMLKAM